jgi:hypothetical protein
MCPNAVGHLEFQRLEAWPDGRLHERLVGTIYQQCCPACTAGSFTIWCEDMCLPSTHGPHTDHTPAVWKREPLTIKRPPNLQTPKKFCRSATNRSLFHYCKKPAPFLSIYASSGISREGTERSGACIHHDGVRFSPQCTR